MASSPITSWQINGGKMETVTNFIFLGSKITSDSDCSHEIKRLLLLGRKTMTNLDSAFKKQRHHFANKGLCRQTYGFPSSHLQLWELDHKEGWALKNWCFWTVVLEKTLESPLNSKEIIKPVNPKGNQSWMFIGRTGAEAKALIHWPPDAKSLLIGKDWCWQRLRPAGGGDDRRWDDWMVSPIQWTWVWANSGRLWCTRKPGVLQSSQKLIHNWAT